jgi:ABC transporter substrate binding protein
MTDDMVGSGLVASLARPAGNTTGVSILASELDVKRLEILHEFVPEARRMAALIDSTTISTRAELASAAGKLGVDLASFEAGDPEQLGRTLDAIAAANVAAVNVLASPFCKYRVIKSFAACRNIACPRFTSGRRAPRMAACSLMARDKCCAIGSSSVSLTSFYVARSPPTCRSSNHPNSSLSLI